MENQPNKPSTYNGNVQNKGEKTIVGEIRLWKQPENGKTPILRGYVRVNAKSVKADDKGYCYVQVSLWETKQ